MKQETFLKSFALQQEQIDYLESLSKLGFNLSAVVRQAIGLHKQQISLLMKSSNTGESEVKNGLPQNNL